MNSASFAAFQAAATLGDGPDEQDLDDQAFKESLPLTYDIVGAYNPNDRGNNAGGGHLVVREPLHVGRLHREKGDALCRPRRKFWELSADRNKADCQRCLSIAQRLWKQGKSPAVREPVESTRGEMSEQDRADYERAHAEANAAEWSDPMWNKEASR